MAERQRSGDTPARPRSEAVRTATSITGLLDAAIEGRAPAPSTIPPEETGRTADVPVRDDIPAPAAPPVVLPETTRPAPDPAPTGDAGPAEQPGPSRWRAAADGGASSGGGPHPRADAHTHAAGLWQGLLLGMWIMGQRVRDRVVQAEQPPLSEPAPRPLAPRPTEPVDDPAGPRLLPLAPRLMQHGWRRHGNGTLGGDGAGGAAMEEDAEGKGDRKWLLLALGLLLLGLLGAAALYFFRPQPQAQTPPPQAPFVQTTRAEPGEGPLVVAGNGVVRPRAEIGLSPQVAGRVEYVNPALQSGGSFLDGEVLVRLDPADYRNQVEQARAEVAQRQVELEQARQERAIALEEYRLLRDRLERERGTGPTADVPYEGDFRASGRPNVLTGGTGPAATATAGGAGGGAAAPGGVSPLALREPQLEAAQAALQAARARYDNALLALDRTVIHAPFRGMVRSEDVDVGQYVAVGEQLARIYSSDAVEVVVPLTNGRAALIPGLWDLSAAAGNDRIAALVSTDYGGERFGWAGYVDRARGDIDPQTRTVDVVVRVPRPFEPGRPVIDGELAGTGRPPDGAGGRREPPLLVGAFTTVRIKGRRPEDYVVIPAQALRNGDQVWQLARARQDPGGDGNPDRTGAGSGTADGRDGDARAAPRWTLNITPVEVIQRTDEVAYVHGLLPGARIVTNGIQGVTDGMAVRTRTEEEMRLQGGGGTAEAGDGQDSGAGG